MDTVASLSGATQRPREAENVGRLLAVGPDRDAQRISQEQALMGIAGRDADTESPPLAVHGGSPPRVVPVAAPSRSPRPRRDLPDGLTAPTAGAASRQRFEDPDGQFSPESRAGLLGQCYR